MMKIKECIPKSVKRILKIPLNYVLYNYYSYRNKNIDYFDYKRLAHPFPVFSYPDYPGLIGNKCYGNWFVLKKKFGDDFHSDCMIEHGVYFAKYVLEDECNMKCIDTIYTYSDYRVNAIQEHFNNSITKRIIPIGPYIQYADNFKSKTELHNLKERYGKILLVFPLHASPGVRVNYDVDSFAVFIDTLSKDYDTVFVSLSGLDILQGNHIPFQKKGYIIVSSGGRNDPFFLNRQKDLIELADMSVSNDIGTHIGYCICLGTPHCLFRQKIEMGTTDERCLATINFQKDIRSQEYDELFAAFADSTPQITDKQLILVKKYWGPF